MLESVHDFFRFFFFYNKAAPSTEEKGGARLIDKAGAVTSRTLKDLFLVCFRLLVTYLLK